MDFRALSAGADAPSKIACDALVVVLAGEAKSQRLDAPLAALLKEALASDDLALKAGRALYVHRPAGVKAPRLVFAVAADGSAKAFKSAVGAALAALKQGGAKHAAVLHAGLAAPEAAHAEALVAAVGDATYVYRHTKPSAPADAALKKVSLLVAAGSLKAAQQGLSRGEAIASGVALARECGNRPANHATPSHLADRARELAKQYGFKVEVLDRKAVEKLGMGAFLAVAQGSDEPLKFIVLRHDGAAKSQAPVVLVGKGITFDTGGISIKPSAEMDEMKFDMGGAASVLGTFRAIGELKLKLNVVGLIPSCDNMPSGRAVKPGDVVTSMSGQTIEILNTDAEGRLILCDALTYAERFKPQAVVDIATLTGACVIALGHHRSGLFSADDKLAAGLLAAGDAGLDPAWRMPLDEDYDEGLKSNFADMGNVGGRAGGSITAARFLSKYATKYRWAHLDIAGTAWKSGAAKGGTGRPVPLLTHFLLSLAG
ncbi:leucyl aminopeptidase [Rivibacter subsaxonicus]|uniref:Probable cytosol aminopeptidase n=1 Tax=Rivibacter subsaxonicus TaxID=457575 RepID=A0A4Q7VDB0_9BURK|nr:leucyl aminopeptidase [Rivibacter subsaxonicus]RZT93864.1 aminopeptidase A [Rivibacter subsaxonicus]